MHIEDIFKEIPRMLAKSPQFDFIIAEFSDDGPFSEKVWHGIAKGHIEAFINLSQEKSLPLIAVVDSEITGSARPAHRRLKLLAEHRTRLVDAHVPTYSTVAEAARAVRKFIDYWQAKAEA
jgi:hypothetical protein